MEATGVDVDGGDPPTGWEWVDAVPDGRQMAIGPPQLPPPTTHDTWVAPLLPTTNTSVWLGRPNWLEAARPAPAGAVLGGVMARGPPQLPPPATHETWVAPLLPTTNTSVWLGRPNCLEAARPAPAGARLAAEMGS